MFGKKNKISASEAGKTHSTSLAARFTIRPSLSQRPFMDTAKRHFRIGLDAGGGGIAAVMNVLIKEASAKFALGSGELVFGACCFQPLRSVLPPYCGATPSARPIENHLNRSMVGTGAMLLLFYAVTHLPLTTGVTLSYTSSIFWRYFPS